MNKIEIQAGNKLIADFVGNAKIAEYYGVIQDVWEFDKNLLSNEMHSWEFKDTFSVDDMMFHENWDWLMYAINKLPELLKKSNSGFIEGCESNIELCINDDHISVSVGAYVYYHTEATGNLIADLWKCLLLHLEYIQRNTSIT